MVDNEKPVVAVVGNPRPASRTHTIAETLVRELARATGRPAGDTVDLATLAPRVLDYEDTVMAGEAKRVLDAGVLVVASPTYKGTYSGLLKSFLDRIGGGALNGMPAVGVLLGGAPNHTLAVDVHLTPLLLELGASIPTRGLFVLESQLGELDATAAAFADTFAARVA
jgi:FMN reductase